MMTSTYANGIVVSETTNERYFKTGPCDIKEAFHAGASAQARHWQEEVPPNLLSLVNAVRTAACRPGAKQRTPESILLQVLDQFTDRSLDAWSA